MNESLKDRLLRYFKGRPGQWIASTEIERVVTGATTYSASNAARRLRDLYEEAALERKKEVVNGKVLAYYRFRQQPTIAEVVAAGNELWNSIKT
jgi:hypothetical protein